MRIDVATAIVASLALHGAFILLPGKTPPQPLMPPPSRPPEAPRMVVPVPEEDIPLVASEKIESPKEPILIGPPRSDEVLVQLNDPTQFIQAPQPPQPDNLKIDGEQSIIPIDDGTPIRARPKEVLSIGDLDQPPVARVQIKPVYPHERRREGVGGTAIVSFIVDTEGNVVYAQAVSATLPEFGAAAVQAVGKWKFKPGIKNAKPANTRMQIPIVFNIDDSAQ